MRLAVILLAAGKSKRFKTKKNDIKKQFVVIQNKSLIEYSLDTFSKIPYVKQIIVVVAKNDVEKVRHLLRKYNIEIIIGGKQRYNSVCNGVKVIDKNIDYVLIHDAARPLVNKDLVFRCLQKIKYYDCVIPAVPVTDTIKIVNKNHEVVQTVDRKKFFLVQTPQVFKKNVIDKIYSEKIINKWTKKLQYDITDDAQLAELEGFTVKIVPGEKKNIKITTQQDLQLMKFYLTHK